MKMRSRLLKVRSEIDQLLMEAKMSTDEFWVDAYKSMHEYAKPVETAKEILDAFDGVSTADLETVAEISVSGKFSDIEYMIESSMKEKTGLRPDTHKLMDYMARIKENIFKELKMKIKNEYGDTPKGKELMEILNRRYRMASKTERLLKKARHEKSFYSIMVGAALLIFIFAFLVDESIIKTLVDSVKKIKSSIVNAFDSKGLIAGLISMIIEPIKEFLKFLISYPVFNLLLGLSIFLIGAGIYGYSK